MKNRILFYTSLILVFSITLPAYAEEQKEITSVESLSDMFAEGTAYVDGRYRYEFVDQDDFTKDAKASTLRTRLGFETAKLHGIAAHLEVEDIQEIGNDNYNSTINGHTDRPVVADPDGTEINQAYLGYYNIPDTSVTFGRKHIVLDNHRFVGDVGWRQNNQTYDSATLTNTTIPDVTLFYSYILNVNRIFGDDSASGDFNSDIHLFNAKFSGCPMGDFTTYAYLLDFENDAPALSTTTFGGRFDGKYEVSEDANLLYDLEYAYQSDYEGNTSDYNVHYWHGEAGVSTLGLTVKGGFESLGSDNGGTNAFTTPLATLHKWNGWADKFLTTPPTGLEDAYASVSYKVNGIHEAVDDTALAVIYHSFSAEEGSADYGTEWDVDLTRKFLENYMFGVRYANYNTDGFATDTQKLIFTLAARFSQ